MDNICLLLVNSTLLQDEGLPHPPHCVAVILLFLTLHFLYQLELLLTYKVSVAKSALFLSLLP